MPTNGEKMALLEIKGLNKSFGGIRAVEDCTFSVEEGSIVSLIGPNGAGKTTVFNLVTGLLSLDSGDIYFDGKKINGLQPHQITHSGISRTFQITRDLQELTVLENMVVQSRVKGFWDMFGTSMLKEEEDRAMELLTFVGIDRLANEKSKNLSYGQKKLLEFASVLMSDPRLIMLDEPAGGVNPTLLESIIDRILQLNKKGITFLIVEHNMELVMKISNPVICMAYGTVLAQGSPKEIQEDKRVLEAYLGE
jgi:neutral amino acid transport system ATP-binding protein